jgi:hypothetical protein
MIPLNAHRRVPWLPVSLAATHGVLFVLTLSFEKTASGGNPFFCVDLPLVHRPRRASERRQSSSGRNLSDRLLVFYWVRWLVRRAGADESSRIDGGRFFSAADLCI